MRLYTDKVVAAWLDMTPRRVRQLRDQGIFVERQKGLYDLMDCVRKYVQYLREGPTSYAEERSRLVKAKREAAEMENEVRRGNLHATQEIELGIKTMLLNFRSRCQTIPAKLSGELASMGSDQTRIFDRLKEETDQLLEELRNYNMAMAKPENEDNNDKLKAAHGEP